LSEPGCPRRRSRLWPFLLIASIVFAVYAWSGQYWLDMVDEGYFLDLAGRVYHGQLPYRDFDTYYTPGIFYLFAGLFQLFGISALPIRLTMAALRALVAVLLVRLTLRGAPWPFAVLPVLIVLALDRWPIEPEPHPAWPALAASLLAMEFLALHQAKPDKRWLVGAGAAAGVAFLFKQNVGAFTALGVAGYLAFRHRGTLGWAAVAFAIVVGVAVTALLWPGRAPFGALALWLPVVAALGVLTLLAIHSVGSRGLLTDLLGETVLTAAPFVLVTVAWLIPLALALRPYPLPLGLFAGAGNQAGLVAPYPDLSPGAKLLVSVSILVVAAAFRRPWAIALAFAVALLVQLAPTAEPAPTMLTSDPQLAPLLGWLYDQFGTLHLYLPALAAWAALAALLFGGVSVRRSMLPWMVLFATLGMLALYPRLDAPHVIVASPPVLIVATWALATLYGTLANYGSRLSSAMAGVLVLAVVVAAVAPQAVWRYATLTVPPGNPPGSEYVPLDLERAPMRLPVRTAQTLHSAVEYIAAGTAPGAPFFAYPAVPLFNFLVDRPNPSRFDHFFPGALNADDLLQVVADLETARPRYVLWDHGGVMYWKTDPANRVLSDYIWRCYGLTATFDLYLVLERHEC